MKVYSRTYSEHHTQIAKALPPLQVPANTMTCFAIPFPSEGILEAIIVSQVSTDSEAVAADIELLNSQLPYPPGNYTPGASPADAINHYRIIPNGLTLTAGDVAELSEEDFGRAFRNIDGGWTLNQRVVYLVITPESVVGPQDVPGVGVITNWNVTLRCRTDIY